jgi:hypothetical protein
MRSSEALAGGQGGSVAVAIVASRPSSAVALLLRMDAPRR